MVKDNGLEYFEELPIDYEKMNDLMEIFKLKDPNGFKTIDNMIIREGVMLIVFNPQTNEYYPRYLHWSSQRKQLKQYFDDGNLYINKNDLIWKT